MVKIGFVASTLQIFFLYTQFSSEIFVTSLLTTVLATVSTWDIWCTSIRCTVTSLLTTVLVTASVHDIWLTI